MTKAIEVKGLYTSFVGSNFQLQNINLSVEFGEFIVIAGANGSGKSTLCRHFNGLLKPDHGRVMINGLEVNANLKKVRQQVGLIFQNADTQIISETVRGDIAFGLENLKLPPDLIYNKTAEIAVQVGLDSKLDHHPFTLSGGEKKRLAIAGVLVMNPDIIIFDEPFSNLDYPGIQQILNQILDLHQRGLTIVVITHEIEQVLAHANRLVIMTKGSIVLDDLPVRILPQIENYAVRQPCSFKFGAGIQKWIESPIQTVEIP